MSRKEKRVITALDFLRMYLEFNTMTPDRKDWTKRKLAKSPRWLYRLLRLEALIKAFGLPTKLAEFHKGWWIDFESPAHDRFFETVEAETPENPLEKWNTREYRDRLDTAFRLLLNYRIRLEKALDPGVVTLCSYGPRFYADRKSRAMNEIIFQNLSLIEDSLVTIISPENKSFRVPVLVREFGYPDVDLQKIDLDWIC